MKKILLILLIFTLVGVFAFAEDLTVEERLDALEAAPASPLAVTGSLSFSVGGSLADYNTNLPAASGTTAGTAKLTVASADEKVVGSVSIDLLGAPTATTALGGTLVDQFNDATAQSYSTQKDDYNTVYDNYASLKRDVDFWNSISDMKTPVAETAIFDAADQTAIINSINTGDVKVLTGDDAADDLEIAIMDAVQKAPAAADADVEIVLTDSTLFGNVALSTYVDAAFDAIIAETTNTDITGLTWDNTIGYSDVEGYLNGFTQADIAGLSDNDRKVLKAAIALVEDWVGYNAPMATLTATTTVAQSLVSGAVLTFNDVADLVDITMNFGSQHVSTGSINLDMSGLQEDAVNAYPSVAFALNPVVEGLTAGMELFFNDTNGSGTKDVLLNTVTVDDDIYTWLNEKTDDSTTKEDVVMGLEVPFGYSMALSEDMAVGVTGNVAVNDLLGGDAMDLGYNFGLSFTGMGADVAASYEAGLGLSKIGADLSYTIMGITASAGLDMWAIAADSDAVFSYVATNKTEMDDLKEAGGMMVDGGVSAALADMVGMPLTVAVTGAYTAAEGTAKAETVVGASAAVTPIENLDITLGGSYLMGDDPAAAVDLPVEYNASVAYAMAPFAFTAGVANGYNSTKEDTSMTWSAGIAVTHSTAVINFALGTGYDKTASAEVMTYSVGTTVKF